MRYLLRSSLTLGLLFQLWSTKGYAIEKACANYCKLAYRDCVAPSPWLKLSRSCSQVSVKLRKACIEGCRTQMIQCKLHDCADPTEEFKAKMKDRLEKEKIHSPKENQSSNSPRKAQ